MKNAQSRETGNIVYTRHKTKTNKTKKHNTIYIEHHHIQDEDKKNTTQYLLGITMRKQTNTNNVNKT